MIYIITDGSGYVKIGMTKDWSMKSRLKQLQCGNPRTLTVLKTIHCDGVADMHIYRQFGEKRIRAYSENIENALHNAYKDFMSQQTVNETSEWFREECVKELINLQGDDLRQYLQEIEIKYG